MNLQPFVNLKRSILNDVSTWSQTLPVSQFESRKIESDIILDAINKVIVESDSLIDSIEEVAELCATYLGEYPEGVDCIFSKETCDVMIVACFSEKQA